MTEEYISGYLEAISRVKDILTPYLGGTNQFFSIPKDVNKSLILNIENYIFAHKSWYDKYNTHETLESKVNKIKLVEIVNWQENFEDLISEWTCDEILIEIRGKNGYALSEYLIDFLLKYFFISKNEVTLYKMLPVGEHWHWGDMMGDEYIFETETDIYIMHFGEST